MSTSTSLSSAIRAAAAEIREALDTIRALAYAGETSGKRWDAANRKQEAAAREFHRLLGAAGETSFAGVKFHRASEE